MSSYCPRFTTKYCKRFPRKVEGISDLLAASENNARSDRVGWQEGSPGDGPPACDPAHRAQPVCLGVVCPPSLGMCRMIFVLEKYVWLASPVLDLLVTMAVKCPD